MLLDGLHPVSFTHPRERIYDLKARLEKITVSRLQPALEIESIAQHNELMPGVSHIVGWNG